MEYAEYIEAKKKTECADAILEVMTYKEALEFIKYMGWDKEE
jgi:hypothetical protein